MNRQNKGVRWFGLLFANSLWSPHIYLPPLLGAVSPTGGRVPFFVSLMLSLAMWFTLANRTWFKVSVRQLQVEVLISILYFCSDSRIHSRDAWGEVHIPGSFWSKKNEKAKGVYINPIDNLGKILIKPSQLTAWSKFLKLTCRPLSKKNKFLLFSVFLK